MFRPYTLPLCQDKGVFHSVSQLPDITRPGIGNHDSHSFRGKPKDVFPGFFGMDTDKMLNNQGDVIPAKTQGRAGHGKYIDPEEKVFSEFFLFNEAFKIFVGGGNDPHINGDRFVFPHPLDHSLFQYPQKLDLYRQRDIPYLI